MRPFERRKNERDKEVKITELSVAFRKSNKQPSRSQSSLQRPESLPATQTKSRQHHTSMKRLKQGNMPPSGHHMITRIWYKSSCNAGI